MGAFWAFSSVSITSMRFNLAVDKSNLFVFIARNLPWCDYMAIFFHSPANNFRRNCHAALLGTDESLLTTYGTPSPYCSRVWFPGMAAPCPLRYWPGGGTAEHRQVSSGRVPRAPVAGDTRGWAAYLSQIGLGWAPTASHWLLLHHGWHEPWASVVGTEIAVQRILRALEAT